MSITAAAAAGAAAAGSAVGSASHGAFGLLRDYLSDSRSLYAQQQQQAADLERDRQKFIFDTALAQQQHDYDTHKYRDALADMKAAGLNPGAMGSGGFSAPSVTYGGGAKTVSSDFDLPGDNNFQAALFAYAKKHPTAFAETYKELALSNAKAVKQYMKKA